MPQLLVRKVDEDLVIRLKQRAARAGRSAEAEHRLILEEALRTGEPSFAERARRHQQTLRKKCLRGEITEGEARVRAQDLVDAPREPIELPILLPAATRMAADLAIPSMTALIRQRHCCAIPPWSQLAAGLLPRQPIIPTLPAGSAFWGCLEARAPHHEQLPLRSSRCCIRQHHASGASPSVVGK